MYEYNQPVNEQEEEEPPKKKTRAEIQEEIKVLEDRLRALEEQQAQAAEAEDYDKAEELQNEIDKIQAVEIPNLQDDLEGAPIEEVAEVE